VATLSKARVCGRWLVGIAGANSSFLVNVVYCMGRDLCDRQIPRPEESYRVCVCVCVCVSECDQVQQ